MARKIDVQEVEIDLTPMIDVIFLLIIFFLLMPTRQMEGQLESYLPNEGSSKPTQTEPETIFNIILDSSAISPREISTNLSFNNMSMGSFTTLSERELKSIYRLSKEDRNRKLKKEYERDEGQFHPDKSKVIQKLLSSLGKAAKGSEKGRDTSVLIKASSDVPFKVVLAILNAGKGASFTQLKFVRPPDSIWN